MVKMMIEVGEGFRLEKAVCNHGYFMMAPNRWIPSTNTLTRPLRLANQHPTSVAASIHHPPNQNYLTITLLLDDDSTPLSSQHRQFIRVVRMLRLSGEDEAAMQEFHKLHPAAKEMGFGRIFRSPDLFEDIVKSILLCYSSWARSLEMAQALCDVEHKLCCVKRNGKKRKRCECKGNFPSVKEIASLDVESLSRHCKLGLRASTILGFARNIQNGSLHLDDIKSYHSLIAVKGFGPFVAANVMMCLGFYQHIPVDSETTKHLEQVHGKTKLKTKKDQTEVIAQIYNKYAPFQCLAYWMERVEFYEKHVGKLSELPNSEYRHVTSINIQNVSQCDTSYPKN